MSILNIYVLHLMHIPHQLCKYWHTYIGTTYCWHMYDVIYTYIYFYTYDTCVVKHPMHTADNTICSVCTKLICSSLLSNCDGPSCTTIIAHTKATYDYRCGAEQSTITNAQVCVYMLMPIHIYTQLVKLCNQQVMQQLVCFVVCLCLWCVCCYCNTSTPLCMCNHLYTPQLHDQQTMDHLNLRKMCCSSILHTTTILWLTLGTPALTCGFQLPS